MKTLFGLSIEILALEACLDNDDLADERRAELVDTWLEAQGDAAMKLDHYAALIKELDARVIVLDKEAIRNDEKAFGARLAERGMHIRIR